ncbi:MAG TPA: hypothetical protein VGC76_12510 [Pyrinomonadaceae bacterium]|jgi:aspartate/glutamate racemase
MKTLGFIGGIGPKSTVEYYRSIMGVKNLGLFGTHFTMQSGFYQKKFSEYEINLSLPDQTEKKVWLGSLFSNCEAAND